MEKDNGTYDKAVRAYRSAWDIFETFVRSDGQDHAAERGIGQTVTAGLYEHWKSKRNQQKFYLVFGAGLELDERRAFVSLASLYRPHAGTLSFKDLLHHDHGFLVPIDRPEYRGPRFQLVVPLKLAQFGTLLSYVGELSAIADTTRFRIHAGNLLKMQIPAF